MIITMEREDEYQPQSVSVILDDHSDIHDSVHAIATCLFGITFSPKTIMDGFNAYLEERGYFEEEDDDTETN